MTSRNKIAESFDELNEKIKFYEKYENFDVKDLIQDAEIVFIEEHICN